MDRVRFQLDEHVSPAIARALRRRGIDAITAREADLLGAPDAEPLAHAHAQGRVMVTQDDDFLSLHHEQQPPAVTPQSLGSTGTRLPANGSQRLPLGGGSPCPVEEADADRAGIAGSPDSRLDLSRCRSLRTKQARPPVFE